MKSSLALRGLFLLISTSTAQLLPDPPLVETSASYGGIVKEGSPVSLHCRHGGTPSWSDGQSLPQVLWILNDRAIPRTTSIGFQYDGDRLHIANFTHAKADRSHDGYYQCVVGNLYSSNMIRLRKAKLEQFDASIKDKRVTVVAGNTALIECNPPSGRPRVTVFEYNNTVTIDETNDRYFLMPQGHLQIADARLSDSGMYRCIASNPLTNTKVQAPFTVTLTVLPITVSDPTLIKLTRKNPRGGRKIDVEVGENVTLSCLAHGVPVPTSTWHRYPSASTDTDQAETVSEVGNLRRHEDNLIISNIQPQNAGTYTCTAENGSPDIVTIVYLIRVLSVPAILPSPNELLVDEGEDVKLNCTITSPISVGANLDPQGEQLQAEFTWRYQGLQNNKTENQNLSDSLMLKAVDESQSGIYQCIVSPKYSPRSVSTYYVVRVKPKLTTALTAMPTTAATLLDVAASNLTVEQIGEGAVRLGWSLPIGSPVFSFSIDLRVTDTGELLELVIDIPRQARNQIVRNLQPGSYKFVLRAFYAGGVVRKTRTDKITITEFTTLPPTTTTSPSTTPPNRFSLRPINVNGTVGSQVDLICIPADNSASVIWYREGLPLSSYDGASSKYTINNLALGIKNLDQTDVGSYECRISANGWEDSASAFVNVQAPRLPDPVPITTTVLPPRAPQYDESNGEVQLTWYWDENFSTYEVQYKMLASDDSSWQTYQGYMPRPSGGSPGSSLRLKLGPGVYKMRLIGSDSEGKTVIGKSTERFTVTVRIVAPDSPTLVSAEQTETGNTVRLTWSYIPGLQVNDKFIVQTRPTDGSAAWRSYFLNATGYLNTNSGEFYLYQLPPSPGYNIRLLLERDGRRSEPSNTVYAIAVIDMTVEATPSQISEDVSLNLIKDGDNNDLMYIILGSVLGSVVLLLVICVAICGIKQAQQRRSLTALRTQKFPDAKAIYNEQMKLQQSAPFIPQNGIHSPPTHGMNGHGRPSVSNGSVSSPQGSQQMGLNINPLNELDYTYRPNNKTINQHQPEYVSQQEMEDQVDYNLMNHYPHFNSGTKSVTPTRLGTPTQQLNSTNHHYPASGGEESPYSHSSLPHRNIPPHVPHMGPHLPHNHHSPNNFSTFLPPHQPHDNRPGKFPHPHSLRNYNKSPASSISEPRRRRRRRRDGRGISSNERSDANTTTDFSSGENTAAEETQPFQPVLPPPPTLLPSYPENEASDELSEA